MEKFTDGSNEIKPALVIIVSLLFIMIMIFSTDLTIDKKSNNELVPQTSVNTDPNFRNNNLNRDIKNVSAALQINDCTPKINKKHNSFNIWMFSF